MTDVLVTMKDVRLAKMCSRGARDFCAKYNLDYSEFLKQGLPASQLEATGNAMVLKVVEIARGRQ
jgi:hypothetical protein